ncbi:MAG: solute:sodium symporter family transporter, partial [Planctomycetes bacterium]|nr:solute:sodium symporter family transporter [Planctomycetota bacterium]
MTFTTLDLVVFLGFLALVVGVSLFASRRERSTEDYFLAGRKLTWWLIGFSLIASNISTEHFVGMAGSAFGRVGLAIASYEWMAAVTLVIVAIWLLPRFLKAGIHTMPEYLHHRYDHGTRAIMAGYLMVAYVIGFLATVVYRGAMARNGIYQAPAGFADSVGPVAG